MKTPENDDPEQMAAVENDERVRRFSRVFDATREILPPAQSRLTLFERTIRVCA